MAATRPNPTLSDDLISEILALVPVKSILRFQLVCKTWLSLINDPAFAKSQLIHATTLDTDQSLILSRFKLDEYINFALLHVDSYQFVSDVKLPFFRGDFELMPHCTIIGCANGIVCVAVDFTDYKTSIYLWNPAIRQSKVIQMFRCVRESLGFGYDKIEDDYKIVRVVMLPSSSEVYSVKKNVWCKVPEPIDTAVDGVFDVCVDGFLCGIGKLGMMVFDLNKEVLNCAIKLPVISVSVPADNNDEEDIGDDDDESYIIESNEIRLIEFNKVIAVIILWDDGLKENKKINMWMLDDNACLGGGGIEASWKLMFSIDLGMPAEIVHGYFSNGDLLILIHDANVWISCNVDKKEAKIVPLSNDIATHLYNRHIYKYTESLVSFEGFKQVKWDGDN